MSLVELKQGNSVQEALDRMNASLNPEQKLGAETTEGPVMLTAGAGAGKTKTLIHRVATLLVKGVPATEIFVSSFTNKAATELKQRLEAMIGENGQYVNAGTFHSLLYKVLQMYNDSKYLVDNKIDMTQCTILDDKDKNGLLDDAIKLLPDKDREEMDGMELKRAGIESYMDDFRNKGYDVNDFVKRISNVDKDAVAKRIVANVWRLYNELCRSSNGIDFNDILLHTNKLLKSDSSISADLARRWKYVMVDEYQDTNDVQADIIDEIVQHHGNVCVVGDEKQSIYKFRGANIDVILGFTKKYPNAKLISLDRNYRSYPLIIMTANALAGHMVEKLSTGILRAEKKITDSPELMATRKLNTVSIVEFESEKDEASLVCQAIMRDLRAGVDGKDIAVLYRNKILKDELERKLVEYSVNYRLTGDTSFFQKAEVKDFISMVRFLFQNWDSTAGFRFMKSTSIGVSVDKAKKAMSDSGINAFNFLTKESEKRLVKRKGETEGAYSTSALKIKPFVELSKELQNAVSYKDNPDNIGEVLFELWSIYQKPSLIKDVKRSLRDKEADTAIAKKMQNIVFVIDRIKSQLSQDDTIQKVIEDLSLMIENNTDHDVDDNQKVQLMTLHASKGLEFPNVYMIGLDDTVTHGLNKEELTQEDEEEQRRLVYVGITRAEKKLTISYSNKRTHHGREIETRGKSGFIKEIISVTGQKVLKVDSPDASAKLKK